METGFIPARRSITGIVLAAAALRIVPHPMNFAPIGALALFGGAYFSSKRAAVAVPLLSLIAGDFVTGFHRLDSVRVRKFSCERCDWVLAAAKEVRIPHRRSHGGRRNSIFPDHQFRGVGDIDRKLSEKFGRPR